MRKIRDVPGLKLEARLSHERTAASGKAVLSSRSKNFSKSPRVGAPDEAERRGDSQSGPTLADSGVMTARGIGKP